MEPEGDGLRVTLCGGPESLTIHWQSAGKIDGSGRSVLWSPVGLDQITVAVRSDSGVTVVSKRGRVS